MATATTAGAPVAVGAGGFVAVNDSARAEAADGAIQQTTDEWLGDYRAVLELARTDRTGALRDCRALLVAMGGLGRGRAGRAEDTLPRSVLDLRHAATRMCASLALGLGEPQQAFDACLRALEAGPAAAADGGLWDQLCRAGRGLPGVGAAARRVMLEARLARAPAGGLAAAREHAIFLESIGAYGALEGAAPAVQRLLFERAGGGLPVPRYAVERAAAGAGAAAVARTLVLPERTWVALLVRLAALYEDEQVGLAQVLRFTAHEAPSQDSATACSRRPSLDDLGMRASKRRREAPGPPRRASRQQQYQENELLGLLAGGRRFEAAEGLLRAMRAEGQQGVPAAFLEAGGPAPLLAWIERAVCFLSLNWAQLADRRLEAPLRLLLEAGLLGLGGGLRAGEGLLVAQALTLTRCYVGGDGGAALGAFDAFLAARGLAADALLGWPALYHHVRAGLAATEAERSGHLARCLARLGDACVPLPFGRVLDRAGVEGALAEGAFRGRLAGLAGHAGDAAWFRGTLFGGRDLAEPAACLAGTPPALWGRLACATLRMLLDTGQHGQAHRWLAHACGRLLGGPAAELVEGVRGLAGLFREAMLAAAPAVLDGAVCELVYLLVRLAEEPGAEDRAAVQEGLVGLLAGVVVQRRGEPGVAAAAWRLLAIDGLDRWGGGEFLRALAAVVEEPGLLWNVLRVLSGAPQVLEGAGPLDQAEPLGVLDLRRARAFERVHRPERMLAVLLAGGAAVRDEARYCELLELLCGGLGRRAAPAARANLGILGRLFARPAAECLAGGRLRLYAAGQPVLGRALLRKVQLQQAAGRRRTEAQQWAGLEDLVRAVAHECSDAALGALCGAAVALLAAELAGDALHVAAQADALRRLVRVALTCALGSRAMAGEARARVLADLFLWLTKGALRGLEEAGDAELARLVVARLAVRPGSHWRVHYALVRAAGGGAAARRAALRVYLAALGPEDAFEVRYQAGLTLLLLEPAGAGPELCRLGLVEGGADAGSGDRGVRALAAEVGARDRRRTQHMHLALEARLAGTVEAWARLFPFLTRAKGAAFSAVWQNDQELAGAHLVARAAYLCELATFLAGLPGRAQALELLLLVARRAVGHLAELHGGRAVLAHVAACVAGLAAGTPAELAVQVEAAAVLERHLDE